jgi:hypothetical protein
MEKAILMSTLTCLLQSSSRTTVEHLRRQIDDERRHGTGPVLAHATSISPSFRAILRDVFPKTYAKVTLAVADRSRVNEALVEIFVDFLDRFGDVTSWDKEHELFLDEVCGRTIDRLNRASAGGAPVGTAAPPAHVALLREDVLKAVEQTIEAPFLRTTERLVELRVRPRDDARGRAEEPT